MEALMQEQLSQEEQISKLKKKKGRIEKGLEIAEKFVQNKTEELEQIEQELSDDSVLEEDTEEKEDLPLKKDEEDDKKEEDKNTSAITSVFSLAQSAQALLDSKIFKMTLRRKRSW